MSYEYKGYLTLKRGNSRLVATLTAHQPPHPSRGAVVVAFSVEVPSVWFDLPAPYRAHLVMPDHPALMPTNEALSVALTDATGQPLIQE